MAQRTTRWNSTWRRRWTWQAAAEPPQTAVAAGRTAVPAWVPQVRKGEIHQVDLQLEGPEYLAMKA
jgi:hypothetical protein